MNNGNPFSRYVIEDTRTGNVLGGKYCMEAYAKMQCAALNAKAGAIFYRVIPATQQTLRICA